MSPWTKGADSELRPTPGEALILHAGQPPVRGGLDPHRPGLSATRSTTGCRGSVRASFTGFPALANAIHGGTVEALQKAEIIAAPLLAIVLMFVFRSLVAAAVPLVMGFATIVAGTGVLTIVNRFIELDAAALNLMTAMGLALGVDYSLLIVSRFREELDKGTDPVDAVEIASRTAGSTVIFAGRGARRRRRHRPAGCSGRGACVGGLGRARGRSHEHRLRADRAPGGAHAARTAAWIAGPSAGVAAGAGPPRSRWASAAAPWWGSSSGVGLLALCAPALTLSSGAPDPGNLSSGSRERTDFETFKSTLGAGWAAPFDVVVVADDGSMADRDDLEALERWEARIERIDGVTAVFGPGRVADQARRLGRVPNEIEAAGRKLDKGEKAAGRLQGRSPSRG